MTVFNYHVIRKMHNAPEMVMSGFHWRVQAEEYAAYWNEYARECGGDVDYEVIPVTD